MVILKNNKKQKTKQKFKTMFHVMGCINRSLFIFFLLPQKKHI